MANKRIVIIGSGIAGLSAAEAARKTDPEAQILILTENSHPPYHRPRLPGVIMDPDSVDKIILHDQAWYQDKNLDLRRGVRVKAVDTDQHSVQLEEGESITYDKLILATGSRSFMP
ncbi:MAG: FAD-dependent oxidoreductase, partial [Clostridiaceae bacterium]|nr:FAD-dependent oxidoreductase [Clostridiaceae bacterium]